MKRSLLVFLVVACLLVSAAGCGKKAAEPGSTGATYKIGVAVSVTGAASTLGEPERNVALMLQKQLDAQGGLIDDAGVVHPIEIIVQDTQGSSDVALQVVKKLIDDDQVVAIVGPSTSYETMALIPVTQEARVSLISLSAGKEIVQPINTRFWTFKVAQSNEHTSPWQVRYAQAKGFAKIANLYVNNAYGEDGAQAIRKTATDAGIEIVLEETFGADDKDMTAQIAKIKSSGAQAVLVTAIPPAAAIFTKQYRELGVELPLLHNSGIAMPSFIELAGAENAEGVIFPMGKLVAVEALPEDDPQKPVLEQFVVDYRTATGKEPSHFAAHSWDAIQLVLQALRTLPAEELTLLEQRSLVRDHLENIKDFVGVDGIFNLSPVNHVGLSEEDVVLVRITNGKWEYFPEEQW